ncbi:response regulator, partial [candidate division KSB1 bacterium]|nr:response regulator [candidate division KSB1 bacterium]
NLAVGLKFNLEQEGYQVELAKDGREAIEMFAQHPCDLIILDIMLPFYDGFEVAKNVREQDPQIPILMLTARTSSDDRVRGLELGADDYLTKPFHLKELLLRVKGMLKRKAWYQKSSIDTPVIQFGNNKVDFNNLWAKKGRKEFRLTAHEAMVLKYLFERRGNIVSRHELLENVWQIKSDIETRTVDNFIARLRKYFEKDPSRPEYIISIRSAGYMFKPDKTFT